MILFNITFCIDNPCRKNFNGFLVERFIPTAIHAGLINPILSSIRAEEQLNTLTGAMSRCEALQIIAPSQEVLDTFRAEYLPALYHLIAKSFAEAVTFFETELDVISLPNYV